MICCDPLTAEAYVNDNVSNASLEQNVGDPDGKSFSTIFDFLQNIWEQLLDMSDNIGTAQDSTGLYARLDSIEASVNKMSTIVKNQSATAGGGCYYTVYSMKPYLEGYKLKLSDGTSSKSCVIMYDEDSDYYSGVLKAPLANNITVEILDMESGISQGKMSTSADTTSGYATINLDTLISNNFTTLARVDDSLAVNFYKDSTYTQDVGKATVLISVMNTADGHVSDFFDSALGLSLESKSYSQLLANQTEFVNVLSSDYKTYMIQDSGFGQSIANSRSCLRTIYDNDELVSLCKNNSTFCSYLQNTTIPKIIQSKTAGLENSVSGKLLIISASSGYMARTISNAIPRKDGPFDNCYYYYYVTQYLHLYQRGSALMSKNGDTVNLWDNYCYADSAGIREYHQVRPVYSSTGYYDTVDTIMSTGPTYTQHILGGSVCTVSAVAKFKFCNSVHINSYNSKSVDISVQFTSSYFYNYCSLTPTPTADSVITYIDLDAED